jgi:hypothetical protein
MNYKAKNEILTKKCDRLENNLKDLERHHNTMMILKDKRIENLNNHLETMMTLKDKGYDNLRKHHDVMIDLYEKSSKSTEDNKEYWYKNMKSLEISIFQPIIN